MDKGQRRLTLQTKLESIAAEYVKPGDKTKHVYYNPPTGFQMEYPCIVYQESRPIIYNADNRKYLNFPHWKITTMTRDPEALDLAPKVLELPRCSPDSVPFILDGIVHHVFGIYW